MKKQYKVTIAEKLPNGKITKSSADVDGLLIIGTLAEERSNYVHFQGTNFALVTATLAIETVCAGQSVEFVHTLQGHLNLVMESIKEKAEETVHE